MLLEFQCANHKSIKEQVTFSMLAGTDDTYAESLKTFDKYRISHASVIYGANGSGKSNLIDAMAFMSELVKESVGFKDGMPAPQYPHKLAAKGTPSEYDIKFIYGDVRYSYGFSIKGNLIDEEYLYYFPNNKKVIVFERDGMEVKPGDKYKNSFQTSIRDILKPNRLFLSCAANYSNVREASDAAAFFRDGMMVFADMTSLDAPGAVGLEVWADLLRVSKNMKKEFIGLLQGLGTGVKDVRIRQRKRPNQDKVFREENAMTPGLLDFLTRPITEARMVYDQFETDLDKEESRGVRRLFQIAGPVIIALRLGQVLVCDELESSLHERVLFEIVRLFQKHAGKDTGQLIFSTHNTNLLNSDLFRRDQVWFTELNGERATDLYSLVELKNVRKYENLAKGYISGRYGGIPMLNENILTESKA